jgi:hypothetical protein
MDIDGDSDERQVDTWSGGTPGCTATPEVDDHKESLIIDDHCFPNNQQIIVRLIKTRNKLPEVD